MHTSEMRMQQCACVCACVCNMCVRVQRYTRARARRCAAHTRPHARACEDAEMWVMCMCVETRVVCKRACARAYNRACVHAYKCVCARAHVCCATGPSLIARPPGRSRPARTYVCVRVHVFVHSCARACIHGPIDDQVGIQHPELSPTHLKMVCDLGDTWRAWCVYTHERAHM